MRSDTDDPLKQDAELLAEKGTQSIHKIGMSEKFNLMDKSEELVPDNIAPTDHTSFHENERLQTPEKPLPKRYELWEGQS